MTPLSPRSGPWLARLILRAFASADDRDLVVDDLDEWYRRRYQERGPVRANLWYLSQACRSAVLLGYERLRPRGPIHWSKKMEELWQDIRYGLRIAKRSPLPTIAIIVTLALGFGTASAVGSAVWSVLLKPLPVPNPEQLVAIQVTSPRFADPISLSYPDFQDWTMRAQRFAAFGAYDRSAETLMTRTGPLPVEVTAVSDGFWRVLDVAPALGRLLTSEDFAAGAAPAVVLTHDFWMREFGGDPAVVGRPIRLDQGAATVVGILPATAFLFPQHNIDLYRPLHVPTIGPNSWQSLRQAHWLTAIARIRPGVPMAMALTELRTIDAAVARENGGRDLPTSVILTPLQESMVGHVRSTLTLLAGIAVLVLLIGVTNVASLRLTQAQGRRREFGMRLVLGAGTRRLVRQMVTESLLLAVAGAGIGFLLAAPMLRMMVRLYPGTLPRAEHVQLDLTVIGVILVVAVFTGLAFAMPQLLQLLREKTGQVSRFSERGGTSGMNQRMRNGLVVLQLALSVTLLVGSGLLLRTFWKLTQVPPGFDRNGVLTFTIHASGSRHPAPEETEILFDQMLGEIGHLPGVVSAGMTNAVPFTGNPWGDGIVVPGSDQHVNTDIRLVSADYLQTLRVPLRAGRYFTAMDRSGTQPVIVINEVLAHALFGRADPLGRTLELEDKTRMIVGVVESLHHTSLAGPMDPEIYLPFQQMSLKRVRAVAIRITGDPFAVLGGVRRIITAADPEIALQDISTLDELVSQSIAPQRFRGALIGSLAVLALILATIGLYGVTSYSVSQRTREFGIRLALGETPSGMSRVVVREALVLSVIGIMLGIGMALLAARALSSLVFGVATVDPVTLFTVPLLLAIVTVLAAFGPARRAGRIDPLKAIQG